MLYGKKQSTFRAINRPEQALQIYSRSETARFLRLFGSRVLVNV